MYMVCFQGVPLYVDTVLGMPLYGHGPSALSLWAPILYEMRHMLSYNVVSYKPQATTDETVESKVTQLAGRR